MQVVTLTLHTSLPAPPRIRLAPVYPFHEPARCPDESVGDTELPTHTHVFCVVSACVPISPTVSCEESEESETVLYIGAHPQTSNSSPLLPILPEQIHSHRAAAAELVRAQIRSVYYDYASVWRAPRPPSIMNELTSSTNCYTYSCG